MRLDKVNAGQEVPHNINVIVEIPMQSHPVKYEVDKKTDAMFVDRFLNTAMYYPCNYGYIPETLSEDGDPCDMLVISPFPLISGSAIRCRPVGMLKMTDESGIDAKILAVPIDKLSSLYHDVHEPADLSPHLLATISHFFEHYKDLEPGKWVKVDGWADAAAAKAEILNSVQRYTEKAV